MHKKRRKAYRNLINALLNCNEGEEWELLQAHPELIDSHFIQMMEQVAQEREKKGDEEGANFLQNLAYTLVSPSAYQEIIVQLLNCANNEEASQILDANRDWVDAGLQQRMLEVAEDLRIQGYLAQANFLMNIVGQLMGVYENVSDPQLNFLSQLLQATYESEGNPQRVYPLLTENLDKLDDNFAPKLQRWAATHLMDAEPEHAQSTATLIFCFSTMICLLPLGNKATNVEIAITGFDLVATIFTREAFPENWASTQIQLGIAYMERIRGDKAENLEKAIASCKAALEIISCEKFPDDWAKAQNHLGLAYVMRIRGDKAENLERAIASFKATLEVTDCETSGEKCAWAAIQDNLGCAYKERIRGDKAENLEKAIASFKAAMKVFTGEELSLGEEWPSAYQFRWAAMQNNLGSAYRERLRGDKAENLEKAIATHTVALEVAKRETFPHEWAKAQCNLGHDYQKRILGEKAENQERSIAAYKAAFEVATSKAFSYDWAMTQNGLGITYNQRIRGDKAENVEKAIASFKAALDVFTHEAFPYDWAMIQNNLGRAYEKRIQGDETENQKQAIAAYKAALEIYTREAFPEQWAMIQHGLGNIYDKYREGDKTENLDRAIAAYKAALEIRTYKAFPDEWAKTQNDLGVAYSHRIRGDKTKNQERAIAAYKAALEIYTREAFPQDYAVTQTNLGYTYQNILQFHHAYNAFAAAIDTIEFLRSEILFGSGRIEDKQKLAEHWNHLYQKMVEVCLKIGNRIEALEYVERSKTRNLVELILNRDLHRIFPSAIISQLDKLRDAIARGQQQLQTATADEPKVLAQHLQQLRHQYNMLQDQYLPLGYGFKFEQFQSNLDDHTVIVEFYLTEEKFLTFIFTRLTQQPILLQAESQDFKELMNWILGYFTAYKTQKSHWQHRLAYLLNLLADILKLDKIIKLIPEKYDRLILIPHQFLHLFPLHALPINSQQGKNTSQILMHRFPAGVSYAPSCQLLELTQTRKRPNFTHLFAVQNPTGDLSYTNIEVEAIKSYFKPANTDVLVEKKATKAKIDTKHLNTFHCAHFSCHGYFNYQKARKSALILADAYLKPTAAGINPEQHLVLDNGEVIDLDKCLTLDALFTPKFKLEQCRLVTLSACETGLIDFKNLSDEYIGLPSGFLVAGSPAVVSSLWTVDDLSTALLMIKFYENLRNQMSLAFALNQAQLWLRDATKEELQQWTSHLPLSLSHQEQLGDWFYQLGSLEKPFQEPYHWAAFCAIGQ